MVETSSLGASADILRALGADILIFRALDTFQCKSDARVFDV